MTEAKKEHPHAEFLRALADGASLSEFLIDGANVETFHSAFIRLILTGEATATITRKPKTRIINGFTVPAPETEAPAQDAFYFMPALNIFEWLPVAIKWTNDSYDRVMLQRGVVHLTREAAIANAKAMCGIDPYADEQTHTRAQADDTEGGEV
jgi:hypothetical protein